MIVILLLLLLQLTALGLLVDLRAKVRTLSERATVGSLYDKYT